MNGQYLAVCGSNITLDGKPIILRGMKEHPSDRSLS